MKAALKIAITACLLGAIIWKLGGVRSVGEQILKLHPFYIVPIIALKIIDRALMTFKWRLLLRARGIGLPFLRGMMIYCASWIWGLFLPTTIGSDAIRAYYTSREGIDSREVIASIIVERFIGFISSILLAILSLILLTVIGDLGDKAKYAWMLVGCMFIAGLAIYAVSVSEGAYLLFHDRILHAFRNCRFAQKLREHHDTYRTFHVDRRSISAFFLMTLGEQMLPIIVTWLIARGMGIDVAPAYFAAALPLAMLVSRLPISLDGIGVFEGIFMVVMSFSGLPAAHALAIAIVGRILLTITMIPWWMAFVISAGNIHARYTLPDGRNSDAVERGM